MSYFSDPCCSYFVLHLLTLCVIDCSRDEEGTKDVYFSRALNDVLKIRTKKENQNVFETKKTDSIAVSNGVLVAIIIFDAH